MERATHNIKRDLMGAANWCTLEGHARALWSLSNSAPAFSAVGGAGSLARSALWSGPASERKRRLRFHRRLCRRDIRSRKKGGLRVGKTKRGKGSKIMVLGDGHALPLAVHVESASPAEVTLLERTLQERFVQEVPQRLIADKAYDSDPLRERLIEGYGTILLCPHRSKRRTRAWHDGRSLRRYRKRWKIERLISWLQNQRRLVTRYEFKAANFLGFVQLACALILLKHL